MAAGNHVEKKSSYVNERLIVERPARGLILAVIGFLLWLAVPWIIILGTTAHGEVVFAVCFVFSVIALGISGITVVQALRSRPVHREGLSSTGDDTGSDKQLVTQSGVLPMRSAAMQILLIPGSVALGFTVFAIIDVIART